MHHGSNEQYLDRNYGGILIIWDRLFGTFEPEGERVRYGLTKNIETFNPVRVAFHEYVALVARRARRARTGATARGSRCAARAGSPRAGTDSTRGAGTRRDRGGAPPVLRQRLDTH